MDQRSNMNTDMVTDDCYIIELTNGDQKDRLSEFPDGTIIGSLKAATIKYPDMFRKTILIEEFSGDGVFVYIPPGVKLDRPVCINDNYFYDDEKLNVGSTNIIMMDSDSSVEVRYKLKAVGDRPYKITKRIRFFLGENSHYRQSEFIDNCAGADVFSDTIVYQMHGVVSELAAVITGLGYTKMDYSTDMKWSGSHTKYSILYLLGEDEKTDVNVSIRHNVPDCSSDVLVKGVAGGNSEGSFSGMVYVAQDAQRTEAYQQSRNILLTDTARILTSPQLEIYADDVRCSHGATVGQMDGDEVYYMRQRGLSQEQAHTLRLAGFVNEIVDRIPEGQYRDIVVQGVENKINSIK